MITLIHGADTQSSYARLTQLQSKFPKHTKIRLDQDSTQEQIYQALFTKNLMGEEEVVILQNSLRNLGKTLQMIEKQNPQKEVIFWEMQELDRRILIRLPKEIKIEHFKKTSSIYTFLDSIEPKSKRATALVAVQEDHLLWHLQYRILELIIAKIGLDLAKTSGIIGRQIQDWQWQKIKDQSQKFELKTLLAFLQGALKIDFMIKTGKTSLDENTLTSVLLLKYLQ